MTITKSTSNVFEDLGFDRQEAENLKLRAQLMISLRRYIKDKGLTQAQAAERLGVSQPRISDLVNGKIDLFSIDMLVNLHAAIGLRVRLEVLPATEETIEFA